MLSDCESSVKQIVLLDIARVLVYFLQCHGFAVYSDITIDHQFASISEIQYVQESGLARAASKIKHFDHFKRIMLLYFNRQT
jgi:hypothetical protein